jgi:signal transduction histidine kinase
MVTRDRAALPLGANASPVQRIAFFAHAIVYALTILLLAVLFIPAAIIVALAWGIALALHFFFALAVPDLRRRWTDEEVERQVPAARADERRASEGRHARDVERLAAALAHEIRNPIAAAKSLVGQIAEDPSAAEVPEYARVAQAELDRVETSIAHLLRFAREEPLRVKDLELTAVVDAALESAKERLADVRVKRDDRGVTLSADPDKLRRVLVNLVTNAADAVRSMPEPRRAITLESGASLDGASAWVRVTDDGPGIDGALRDRVFEPWVTGKNAGTGLGLPIARKLCEAHGGSLEIERTGTTGTSMLVTLPRGAP